MFLLIFLIWIILNGKVTIEIVLFGIALSAVILLFANKYTEHSFKNELLLYKKMPLYIAFFAVLAVELLKANISVIGLTLSPKREAVPKIVKFKTTLKTKTARALLANAITITPGTITAMLEDDEFTIHCLDEDFAEGLGSGTLVALLEKIEA